MLRLHFLNLNYKKCILSTNPICVALFLSVRRVKFKLLFIVSVLFFPAGFTTLLPLPLS